MGIISVFFGYPTTKAPKKEIPILDTEFLQALPGQLLLGGIRVLLALLSFLVAARLITLLFRRLERHLMKKGVDKTATRAIVAVGRYGALLVVVLLLLSFLGVDTGALTALAATLGVGVGLAINGALANLAGGVLLLFTRPFKLDDYIEAAGVEGTVEDIRLVTTRLCTVDNRIIYLPTGTVSSGTIINYSESPLRRLDLLFSLPDTADTEGVRALLLALAKRDARILPDPAPYAVIVGRDEGSVQLSLRAYVKNPDYWDVRFSLLEAANTALQDAGIPPVGQRIDIRNL